MKLPKKLSEKLQRVMYSLATKYERKAARILGKGFGTGTMEEEINGMRLLGKPPFTLAIDIGGNVGNYTAELLRQFPSLEIHLFEPSATNIKKLQERFNDNQLVTIIPCAVSDATAEKILYANKSGSSLGSLTKRKLDHFNIPFDEEETVQTIRFEEYWRNTLASRTLDLVKIDVEGHELDVLRGFGEALQATRVLQFEFGGCNIDTRTFFQDFWYFFTERNFILYRITPYGVQRIARYREHDEFFSTTNYIAVNNMDSITA